MEGRKSEVTVEDMPHESRLVARVDGQVVGVAEYIRTDHLLAFVHTEVDPEREGEGVGSTLAQAAMELAKAGGREVLPVCPFIAGWMNRHPEYAGLRYRPTSKVTD